MLRTSERPHLLTVPLFSTSKVDNPSFSSLLQQVELQALILATPTSLPYILTVGSLSSFEIYLKQQFHGEAIFNHHIQCLPGLAKLFYHMKTLCFLCCTYDYLKFLLIYLSVFTLPQLQNLHKETLYLSYLPLYFPEQCPAQSRQLTTICSMNDFMKAAKE